jgi:SAM-dependent methyltransferase
MAMSEYDEYVSTEWEMFARDPARDRNTLDETIDLDVTSVLDVGCGAGQELLPFVRGRDTLGVGVDVSPTVGQVGRRLFATHMPEARIVFLRAAAEALPFAAGSFDVVVCRLALPYTHNATALSEMARVLRPGGRLLLKIHHPRFYLDKFGQGLRERDILSMIHAGRVMAAGALYHCFGRQIRLRLISHETFLTKRLLRREITKLGLSIRREMPDSNPLTPSFSITKAPA